MADIPIKRVYEPPAKTDGKRFLVDRLWPRGLRKADAVLDGWWKDLAPSPALRTWFGHEPERFVEFKRRYKAKLRSNPQLKWAVLPEPTRNRWQDRSEQLPSGAHDQPLLHLPARRDEQICIQLRRRCYVGHTHCASILATIDGRHRRYRAKCD